MDGKNMKLNDKEIHSVLINSVRYCLTRHSYASECVRFVLSHWAEIPNDTKRIIIRDVDKAIQENQSKAFRWPDHISCSWECLRELGAEYLPNLRSLQDVSIYLEGGDE